MWWIIIVIVVIVWGIGGATVPATGANGGPPKGEGCDACKGLDWWWFGLRPWQKTWEVVWYLGKKLDCYIKGCPTK